MLSEILLTELNLELKLNFYDAVKFLCTEISWKYYESKVGNSIDYIQFHIMDIG
jgi:hypothetical protein